MSGMIFFADSSGEIFKIYAEGMLHCVPKAAVGEVRIAVLSIVWDIEQQYDAIWLLIT